MALPELDSSCSVISVCSVISTDTSRKNSLPRVAVLALVVIGYVTLLAELDAGQPESLGFGHGLLFSPLIARNTIDSDDHSSAVSPSLAMDEDGPIFPRVNDGQSAVDLLVRRTPKSGHGNVEISHAQGHGFDLFFMRVIAGAAKIDNRLDPERG